MKINIKRSQTEGSGLLGGKKYTYFLRISAEPTNQELEILNKYGYLAEKFILDPEISARISVDKEVKGPQEISINQLQKGIEWSCNHLPLYFSDIPNAVRSQVEKRLGIVLAREDWGGKDEVIEF